jgi:DNA-directed RNA polymerase I, II, and III subunit RPABC2
MSDDENSYTSDNEENNPITLKTNNTPMKIVSKGKYEDNDEIDDSEVDDNESSDEDDDEEVDVEVEDPLLKITGGAEEIDDDDDAINDDDDEDSDIELDEEGEPIVKKNISETKTSKTTKLALKKPQLIVDDEEDEEDDEFDDNYLQKFDNDLIKNYVNDFHPECLNHNYDEISKLTIVTRNQDGIIVDPLHRTIPYLTKYEKARVLGQRAKQIETGAKPLVKVPENIVDSYIIAELELREKKVPFIIRRPIPGGGCEYWNIKDLEQIAF